MIQPRPIQVEAPQHGTLPLLFKPFKVGTNGSATEDLASWMASRRESILELLGIHGAILFRQRSAVDAAGLSRICAAMQFELMNAERDNAKRTEVQDKIHTSSDVPSFVPIALHNEFSYTARYPKMVLFCCEIPPRVGGETPIVDMQKVYRRLPRRLVAEFESRSIMYIDNLPRGNQLGRPGWPRMFGTSNRHQVEEICRQQQIEYTWIRHDRLRLCGIRPAVLQHPGTGENVWFNQAHIFHPSYATEFRHLGNWLIALALESWEAFQRVGLPAKSLAQNALFGDGSPIPRATMDTVRRAIWEESVCFPWKKGDVLLLDNLRVAHGRMPFSGRRRILAAMIER